MSELHQIHGSAPAAYVLVDRGANAVTFEIQQGPIKEVGENGCQIDEVVRFARDTIAHFQREFPCDENEEVLICLDKAMSLLAARKKNREARGVEGKNEV